MSGPDWTIEEVLRLPLAYGRCVGITTFRDKVLLATETGQVFELVYHFETNTYGGHVTGQREPLPKT